MSDLEKDCGPNEIPEQSVSSSSNDTNEQKVVADEDTTRKEVKKTGVIKPMTQKALLKLKAKQARKGVVYLSRIPPFMQPSTLRNIMSDYGEIGRIFLVPEDAAITRKRKKFKKNRRKNFVEGWIEFSNKKIAKAVAETFNNTCIGGKKRSRYHDDIWNIKYLSGFKWNHLTEKMAYDREIKDTRMREALSAARKEDKFYRKNFAQSKRLERKGKLGKRKRDDGDDLPKASKTVDEKEEIMRNFKQQRVLGPNKEDEPRDLQPLMSSLFGQNDKK
eukprot:188764_1